MLFRSINIFSNDFDHEFKVIYFKTPRFFPSNQDGIDALLKAISDYITGKIVYMDIISTSNNSYPRDRLVPVSELPEADLDKLARLCINKNLLSESELRFELQAGSSICINFWDQNKNFCYKMQNGKLIKE